MMCYCLNVQFQGQRVNSRIWDLELGVDVPYIRAQSTGFENSNDDDDDDDDNFSF